MDPSNVQILRPLLSKTHRDPVRGIVPILPKIFFSFFLPIFANFKDGSKHRDTENRPCEISMTEGKILWRVLLDHVRHQWLFFFVSITDHS